MKRIKYVEINNVRDETMHKKWQQILSDGIDPFNPAHVEKYIDGKIIMKTTHWYVFKNDHQYKNTKHHFVIVSNNFYKTDQEITNNEWLELKQTKEKLCEKYHITSGGFSFRFGDMKVSGASVQHFHAHIIVPQKGKSVAAWFGSKKPE